MENVIPIIWLTTMIWTIIPNLLLGYKYYTKKVKDIHEAGFLHFICLYLFIITSVLMTGELVAGLF
jgi:hypothetical protein